MQNTTLPSLSECMVFFDFDNTITNFDVLDDIIKRFSVDKKWLVYERAWRNRKIGSRACIEAQLGSVRIDKKSLSQYLSMITIDPHFLKFFAMLKREKISPVILSDNFTFVINAILENNGLKGLKVFANELHFNKDRLIPTFPYRNKYCSICAHCKKKNLLSKNVRDKIIMYIGDGISDICPAQNSHIVFAKGKLLRHLRKLRKLCMAFDNLEDICDYFRGLEK